MNLQPTFQGYVHTTQDALILFQAVICGTLPQVSRRPHERERNELIKSGSVFIFNEDASGIKRWTDGIAWSPSRIYDNFLLYRQLEKPFCPGEKKRTAKKSSRKKYTNYPGSEPYARDENESTQHETGIHILDHVNGFRYSESALTNGYGSNVLQQQQQVGKQQQNQHSVSGLLSSDDVSSNGTLVKSDNATRSSAESTYVSGTGISSGLDTDDHDHIRDDEAITLRSLVGSLVDSYGFKKGGLVKRTMSIVYNGQQLHLVSYYDPKDVLSNMFRRPSEIPSLKSLGISEELTSRQNFRVPLDGSESRLNNYDIQHKINNGGISSQRVQQQLVGAGGNGSSGHYSTQQQSLDLGGYDLDLPLESAANYIGNSGYNNGHHQSATGGHGQQITSSITGHPQSSYISGYRPFSSSPFHAGQLPVPHQYHYNSSATSSSTNPGNSPITSSSHVNYYYGSGNNHLDNGNGNGSGNGGNGDDKNNITTSVDNQPLSASSSGNARALPSLAHSNAGYVYQSYSSDYSTVQGGSTPDPRRLPDNVRLQGTPYHAAAAGAAAGQNSYSQQQSSQTASNSPEGLAITASGNLSGQHGQSTAPYGYGYGYNYGQW